MLSANKFLSIFLALSLVFSSSFASSISYADTNSNCQNLMESISGPKKVFLAITDFIKKNPLTIAPLSIIPVAALTGGDVGLATGAALQLSAGAFVIDKAIGLIVDNVKKIAPKPLLVPALAASMNLTELGASQAAAFHGDPIPDVASTPMGANMFNVINAGAAILITLRGRAVREGFIRETDYLTPEMAIKTIKSMSWKTMYKDFGLSGLFALDSIIFQFVVRPAMKQGNYIPLGGWLAVNLPLLYHFMYTSYFSVKGKLRVTLEDVSHEDLDSFMDHYKNNSKQSDPDKALVMDVGHELKRLKTTEASNNKDYEVLALKMRDLKTRLENNPDFAREVGNALDSLSEENLQNLFEMAKIKVTDKQRMTKAQRTKTILKFLAGVTAICAIAPLLDHSVTQLSHALPYLTKSAAGFFVMSYVATFEELFAAIKLFGSGQDNSAARNVAGSSAYNIVLGQLAMITGILMSMAHR